MNDGSEPLDLTDDERAALIRLLRQTLDNARYPFASRRDPIKAILAKLEPPVPLPSAGAPPRHGRYPKRGHDKSCA